MCKLFRLGHRIMKINNITPGLLRFQNHSCCFSNHSFLYSVKCSPNGMAPVPVIFLVASSGTLYACQLSLNRLNTMLSVWFVRKAVFPLMQPTPGVHFSATCQPAGSSSVQRQFKPQFFFFTHSATFCPYTLKKSLFLI